MNPVVYDAGVLIRADRNDRRVWAEHRIRLEAGAAPLVPTTVIAQASRSPRQASLRRLLRGCDVVPFDEIDAHRAGSLLGKSTTKDVVDASVAAVAIRRHAHVVSDDEDDIARLLSAARSKLAVVRP
jgi:predicted nucleic acid-binding protein